MLARRPVDMYIFRNVVTPNFLVSRHVESHTFSNVSHAGISTCPDRRLKKKKKKKKKKME